MADTDTFIGTSLVSVEDILTGFGLENKIYLAFYRIVRNSSSVNLIVFAPKHPSNKSASLLEMTFIIPTVDSLLYGMFVLC